ncbi:MAG: hypothetical protein J7L25_11305 [Deltaproteobacteria bacterium]|nr:hypothetical protein [Candidatus Tharpella aukensis]
MIALNNVYAAADPALDIYSTMIPVSRETLDSKIKDAELNKNLDDATRTKLLTHYRKTLNYLEMVRFYNETSQSFISSRQNDPEQAARIREILARRQAKTKASRLSDIAEDSALLQLPLAELEQRLFTERANLAAVTAKLSDVEQQLLLVAARPNAVRQQLLVTENSQEEVTARLLKITFDDELPLLTEATNWMLQARQLALRSKIRMLDKELLSLPMRKDLFHAARAQNEVDVKEVKETVNYIQKTIDQLRYIEAKKEPNRCAKDPGRT